MKENFPNLAKEIDFQEVQEAQRGARKKYSKSWKARTYIQDYSIQQSCHLEWKDRLKCFPDKVKLKEFIITKPILYEMLKDLSKKKKIKNANSKMTTNSQLSTQPKKKQKTKMN